MPMAQATTAFPNPYQMRLQAAANAGDIYHIRTGQAAWLNPALNNGAGVALGGNALFSTGDLVNCTKPAGISFLDGGQVYWSWSNSYTGFKRAANSQDFFLGTAYGNATSASTQMSVILNQFPAPLYYDLDLGRDEMVPPVVIGTAAYPTMGVFRYGGSMQMILAATNEAEKVDLLGVDSFPATGSLGVVEMSIDVLSVGSGSHPTLNIGVASGTNATDITSAANYVLMNVNGNSTKINFQSKDGTSSTIVSTDSTKTLTAGTPFEVWMDMRNAASVAMYVEGVAVLTSTVFNVSAAASAWKLICHLVKASSADTFSTNIRWLRWRNATQGVQTP